MLSQPFRRGLGATFLVLAAGACAPELVPQKENRQVPTAYSTAPPAPTDTTTSARAPARTFFPDPYLQALIDSALVRNQELNITRQEIEIARQEIRARKGEYLPFVGLGGRAGLERVGRYTIQGATEENIDIHERRTPDPLPNFELGAVASWEVDIWHRLRTARQAAVHRYLASVEGRNFTATNLVAEIATSYYELLALDAQLTITRQNIEIQRNALTVVQLQKESARVTELAVRRFVAQVQNTVSRQYDIQQRITETENRLNFLAGRFPQPVARSTQAFTDLVPAGLQAGVPVQLLQNRPDIRQAEQALTAAKLDVRVARARFYPSLTLSGSVGFQAFQPGLLLNMPQSLLYTLGADLMGPLINRNGLKAGYYSANARQTQALLQYQRAVLNAYLEVANQLANARNLAQRYDAKAQEVAALTASVAIANSLFQSARAEYSEVLFTQRDALESTLDLIEIKRNQFHAGVNAYRALGGGWR